jgi:transposase
LDLLRREVPASSLVIAIDPGKVLNRVWLTTGGRGLIGEPVSLPVLREGLDELQQLVDRSGVVGAPVIGLEETGGLHRAWASEIERRWPGSLRLFAPSQTTAARAQLGSRRFKTDDRDCAAMIWLLRQGAGRRVESGAVEALLGTVRHRRQLVDARKRLQQRLHDQLNALCPGLSAPGSQGRALIIQSPTGQAVLACAATFAGRPPTPRSLLARAPGRMTEATAAFWAGRWKRLLAPPADAELRAARLGRDQRRWRDLQADITTIEQQLQSLLAQTAGQVLTTLPGVAVVRAAAFSAFTLPIDRWPTAEHLYSATGLAPAAYQSSTITRRAKIARTGLAEHRDALMGIAWGLSLHAPAFAARHAQLTARGMRPIQARVALARHACRLCWRLLQTQQPYDDRRYARARRAGGDGVPAMPHDGAI